MFFNESTHIAQEEEEDLKIKIDETVKTINFTRYQIKLQNEELYSLESDEKQLRIQKLSDIDHQTKRVHQNETYINHLKSQCEELFKPVFYDRESFKEEVELIYNDQAIVWTINILTTYEDLAKVASDFWGFNRELVFLSSQPPELGTITDVYLPNQLVYPDTSEWENVRLRDYHVHFYIVFSKQFLQLSFLDIPMKPSSQTQPSLADETPSKTGTSPEKNIKKSKDRFQKRIRNHQIFALVQTCAMIALTGLWIFSILFDYNISSACWINSQIQSALIGDFYEIQSIYPIHSSNKYYTIREESHYWDYQNTLENLIFLRTHQNIQGGLSNFNFIYGHVSLRQVRSELRFCENTAGQTTACPPRYSLGKNTTDYSSQNEGFLYDSEGEHIYYFGSEDVYSTDGFEAILDPRNHATWSFQTRNLIANNWIDVQTRGIFMAINVVNPSESILTNIILSTEIGHHGSYIPLFKIAYYNYDHLTAGKIGIHIILILLLSCLLAYEIRELSLQEDEAQYFEVRKIKTDISNNTAKHALNSWEAHDKLPFYKRLRFPQGVENLIFLTLIAGFVIEVIYTCWTLIEVLNIEMDADDFTDLYALSQRIEVVNTIRLLVFILMSMISTRLIMLWFTSLAEKYVALTNTIKQIYPFFFFIFFSLTVYAVAFYFIIGPYSVMSSSMYESFLNTLNFSLGQFTLDEAYNTFFDPSMLAALLIVFIILDFLVFALFIFLIQWEIASVKCKSDNM